MPSDEELGKASSEEYPDGARSRHGSAVTVTTTSPLSVNLHALLTRFTSTCATGRAGGRVLHAGMGVVRERAEAGLASRSQQRRSPWQLSAPCSRADRARRAVTVTAMVGLSCHGQKLCSLWLPSAPCSCVLRSPSQQRWGLSCQGKEPGVQFPLHKSGGMREFRMGGGGALHWAEGV